MSTWDARGAVIEIVERRHEPDTGSVEDSTVVPDQIRLNGQPLLCSADHPVTVHGITIPNRDVVLVTLTVFARRVVIGTEDATAPEPGETHA